MVKTNSVLLHQIFIRSLVFLILVVMVPCKKYSFLNTWQVLSNKILFFAYIISMTTIMKIIVKEVYGLR